MSHNSTGIVMILILLLGLIWSQRCSHTLLSITKEIKIRPQALKIKKKINTYILVNSKLTFQVMHNLLKQKYYYNFQTSTDVVKHKLNVLRNICNCAF